MSYFSVLNLTFCFLFDAIKIAAKEFSNYFFLTINNPSLFFICSAANDCCLVFDGFIVIDNSFHTNDSSIRAAGTVTKYKRKYYADQWVHSNFNSKEVGIAVS